MICYHASSACGPPGFGEYCTVIVASWPAHLQLNVMHDHEFSWVGWGCNITGYRVSGDWTTL